MHRKLLAKRAGRNQRGAVTLLDAFEGRTQLIAYYFMWHSGKPAPEQCEGCTRVTTQVRELGLSGILRGKDAAI